MRGVTKLLRELTVGEQVIVTGTARDNIYRIARENHIKVKVEKFAGGFYVTRIAEPMTVLIAGHQPEVTFPAALPDQTHWEVREGRHLDGDPAYVVPVEDWRFTKDKPEFHENGNVYRQQTLAPDFKQRRTVQVDSDDHEQIIRL